MVRDRIARCRGHLLDPGPHVSYDLTDLGFGQFVLERGHSLVFDTVVDVLGDPRIVHLFDLIGCQIVRIDRRAFDSYCTTSAIFSVTSGAILFIK